MGDDFTRSLLGYFQSVKDSTTRSPLVFSNFDQIEYYEVDEAELTRLNNSLLTGNFDISGEIVELDYSEYLDFCERVDPEVEKLNSIKSSLTHKLAEEDMQSFENWENELRDLASKKRSYATDEKIHLMTQVLSLSRVVFLQIFSE